MSDQENRTTDRRGHRERAGAATRHRLLPLLAVAVLLATRAADGQVFVDSRATGAGNGSSWADAYTNLRTALRTGPGEFWVAEGTYTPAPPDGSRIANFRLVSDQQIYGGFAGTETVREERDPLRHPTILSGDLNGDDHQGSGASAENSHHVVYGCEVDESTIVDGFTITRGAADRPFGLNAQAAGLLLLESSPTFVNCRFIDNTAHFGAAAVAAGGSPVFERCEFRDNVVQNGRGGAIFCSADVTIIDCVFESNRLTGGGAGDDEGDEDDSDEGGPVFNDGGAIFNDFRGKVTIRDSLFFRNSATNNLGNDPATGGAICHFGALLDVVNCSFTDNLSNRGGGVYAAGVARFENSLFNSNEVIGVLGGAPSRGGAVMNAVGGSELDEEEQDPSVVTLVGCVVTANTAEEGAGVAGNASTLTNCIVWNNADLTGTSRRAQLSGKHRVFSSCVQNLPPDPDAGNIDQDPRFVDADGFDGVAGTLDDDLRLAPGSPCIDAGDNSATTAATDLLGNPRFLDDPETPDTGKGNAPIVDMGPYEFFVEPGISFRRGDANTDGMVDVSDPVAILAHLLVDGRDLRCQKSADVDDTGSVVITDAIVLLTYIFVGGVPPVEPFVACGADRTVDELSCEAFPDCDP